MFGHQTISHGLHKVTDGNQIIIIGHQAMGYGHPTVVHGIQETNCPQRKLIRNQAVLGDGITIK